ncbi:MAG: Na+/H+ antiporter [Candidatus Eremiobacteraeota bacterium]|nr:Na+/H+ antiporter [Candidatus Eremiobacteraeota bacterium]
MSQALVLITFLAAVVFLTVVARRFRIPYPIAFVIGGVALAFSRHLPRPHLEPDLILLLILPPLLYSAAWTTDALELRRNIRPISLLAIGLVIFTTAAVAAFAHYLLGFGWPLAFTLGAIVSPPDAVAAEAIFDEIAIPRRVAAVISGECLFNDATALVLYRFALAAAVTGAFSLTQASISFFVVAAGGVAIGIVTAFAVEVLMRYITRHGYSDPMIASLVFLLSPFVSYVPAEALHFSGVLAAVVAGLVSSRRSSEFIDSETRLLGGSVWQLLTFVLNAFAFLLIGLELPEILRELFPHVRDYALYGLALSAMVIIVRILWVFPATWIPRLLSATLRRKDPSPPPGSIFVLAWSGMRGIVSLAAALALPYSFADKPFPERGATIFFTCCVVFVTLVLQGLTLGPIVEWLGVAETSKAARRESLLRIRALEAGLRRLRDVEDEHRGALEADIAGRLMEEYQQRIDVLRGRASPDGSSDFARAGTIDRRLQREALDAERRTITAMRNEGEIPDNIFRSIEYDLDLAALRLAG